MEGNGFLIAARPHHAHAIEIRGISDLIENKADADAGGSQPRAAANAAAFCFEMINQIETDSIKHPDTNSLEFRKKLVSELRSEEHTSELQSIMRISYAVFCLKQKKKQEQQTPTSKHIIL